MESGGEKRGEERRGVGDRVVISQRRGPGGDERVRAALDRFHLPFFIARFISSSLSLSLEPRAPALVFRVS